MAQSIEIPEEYRTITLSVFEGDEVIEKAFKLEELLAVCTKAYYEPLVNVKGGALVFVKGQEDPFVTVDAVTVRKIMGRLEQNPYAKQFPLIAKGSSNLRILEDAYRETPKYFVLKSGAKLLVKEGH